MNELENLDAKTFDAIARSLVRPLVTILFAGAFIGFTYLGTISGEVFAATAGMVLAFWFSSRTEDRNSQTQQGS